MKLPGIYNRFFFSLLPAFMVACGGGGGGSDTLTPEPGPDPTVISLQLLNKGTGVTTTEISKAQPGQVVATLTQGATNLSGVVISFSLDNSDLASFDPEVGTALTDASGVARISLNVGMVAGAGTVTATIDSGENAQIGFESTGDAEPEARPNNLSLTLQDPANGNTINAISNDQPGKLLALLTDPDGAPIPNAVILFTSTLGILNPSSGTALTNSQGRASIALLTGTVQGAGTASANTGSGTTALLSSANFQSAGDAPDTPPPVSNIDFTLALQDGSGNDITQISAAQTGFLIATLKDAQGTVIPQQLITFSTTIANLNPSSATALTNPQGQATIILTAGTIPGAGEATATFTQQNTAIIGFETAGDEDDGTIPQVNIDLKLLRESDGAATNTISADSPGRLEITVTNDAAQPIANLLVTVTTTLGSVNPISGTTLTDSNGVASVGLFAGSDAGAATATATAGSQSNSISYLIGEANISIGFTPAGGTFTENRLGINSLLDDDPAQTNLSPGGTAIIIADLIGGDGLPFKQTTEVTFSSPCAADGRAEIDTAVNTTNGRATATYRANGCIGPDLISATADTSGRALIASATLTVEQAQAGSIEFISSDPASIVLQGTGGVGRSETSTLVFRIVDVNGNPSPNQDVSFALTTDIGGITLAPPIATSNGQGLIQVVVTSGTVPTSVRVKASVTVDNGGQSFNLTTLSDLLVVSTGLPDQNSFSLSAATLNPEAWDTDGEQVVITARMADHFNNPVPDGTTVTLTTEFGRIETENCTTINGTCSVIWNSQNPRFPRLPATINTLGQSRCPELTPSDPLFPGTFDPLDPPAGALENVPCRTGARFVEPFIDVDDDNSFDPIEPFTDLNGNGIYDGMATYLGGMGQQYGGRSTILAFSLGEESFIDVNGNGIYDEGEPFTDLTEAFRDDNEDGLFGNPLTAGSSGLGRPNGTQCYEPQQHLECYQAGGDDEEFIDFNQDQAFNRYNGIYNGTLCPEDIDALDDSKIITKEKFCTRTLVHVRNVLPLIMTGNTPFFMFYDGTQAPTNVLAIRKTSVDVASEPKRLIVDISDLHSGIMPAGTTITISAVDNCKLSGDTTRIVANTNRFGYIQMAFTASATPTDGSSSGSIEVAVTTPKGVARTAAIGCTD